MSTRIETENPENGLTIDLVTAPSGAIKIVVSQDQGAEALVMDMETARKLGFVLQGMTNTWRRDNPSGGRIHASDE